MYTCIKSVWGEREKERERYSVTDRKNECVTDRERERERRRQIALDASGVFALAGRSGKA